MEHQNSFTIGSIARIPLYIDTSWFIIFLLVVGNLGLNTIPSMHPSWSMPQVLFVSVSAAILAFVSVVIHELAHALVAKAHFLEVEAISLFLLGGIAHIRTEPKDPYSEFKITLAGPLASFIIGVIALSASQMLNGENVFTVLQNLQFTVSDTSPLPTILFWVGQVNLMLAIFNLIPALPLDGGRLVRATLWQICKDRIRATHWLMYSGLGLGWALMMMGVGMLTGIEYPLFEATTMNAVWFLGMGWFLQDAGRKSVKNIYYNDI